MGKSAHWVPIEDYCLLEKKKNNSLSPSPLHWCGGVGALKTCWSPGLLSPAVISTS